MKPHGSREHLLGSFLNCLLVSVTSAALQFLKSFLSSQNYLGKPQQPQQMCRTRTYAIFAHPPPPFIAYKEKGTQLSYLFCLTFPILCADCRLRVDVGGLQKVERWALQVIAKSCPGYLPLPPLTKSSTYLVPLMIAKSDVHVQSTYMYMPDILQTTKWKVVALMPRFWEAVGSWEQSTGLDGGQRLWDVDLHWIR